jgi:hypothetical protein
MVSPCGLMGAHPIDRGTYISASDNRVDQAVTPAVGEVIIAEAESAQVAHIVRQCEIQRHVRTRDLARFGPVGFQHNRLLDRQESITA